jgi:hypothetical protein
MINEQSTMNNQLWTCSFSDTIPDVDRAFGGSTGTPPPMNPYMEKLLIGSVLVLPVCCHSVTGTGTHSCSHDPGTTRLD